MVVDSHASFLRMGGSPQRKSKGQRKGGNGQAHAGVSFTQGR